MAEDECCIDTMMATFRTAAKEAGSHVVETILALEDASIPVAAMDVDQLVALIRAVKPRIVYSFSLPFAAADQVREDLLGEDADEALMERPRLKKLVARWRSRDGQTAQVSATVVVDGVMHGLVVGASWYSDYEADVADHREEGERLRDERERCAEAEARKRLDPFVGKLMADPRFSGPKVGHAKRLALAQEIFPDEDRRVLEEAVDLAESRHWLATGR